MSWLSGSRPLSSRSGGGLPFLFSLISNVFVHYLGRDLPLGWLSGSRSLSSQGGGALPYLFSLMSDLFVHC